MKHQSGTNYWFGFGALLYVVMFFTLNFMVFAPPVSAATGDNFLFQLGQNCKDVARAGEAIDSDTDPKTLWDQCENRQRILHNDLDCSDQMFYQATDPADSSVKLNKWYVKADAHADCYQKATSKFAKFTAADALCKSARQGSDNWKECEKEQNRLHNTVGCSNNFYLRSSSDVRTLDSTALSHCQTELDKVGGLKLVKSDGTTSTDTVKEAVAAGATGASGGQADCESGGSPLGWIICPVIDMGAGLSDFVFKSIVSPLLKELPISTDTRDPGYIAWQQFRLLGNILLIGSLLAVAYSQAKGGK